MAKFRPSSEPRPLWIEGPAGRLESVLRVAASGPVGAAILAHPHPLYGGTLHNPVIFHTDRELSRSGWTTLRFNFRGVGRSEGMHDDGRGEVDDVGAAVSWLRGLAGEAPVLVIGFSFGSWCGIRWAVHDPTVSAVVAIGLPVRKYAFPELAELECPLGVVQARNDEFGSPEQVEDLVRSAGVNARIQVVEGTTHLFPRVARRAGEEARAVAEWCLAAVAK